MVRMRRFLLRRFPQEANVDREEAKRALDRYKQLNEKDNRTVEEQYELNRLLHQVGLFFAVEQGKTKQRYADENRASKEAWIKAKKLRLSEPAFVLAGVTAAAHEEGQTESEFLVLFRDMYPEWITDEVLAEIKRADLWPW
jgi:hypothetical protein